MESDVVSNRDPLADIHGILIAHSVKHTAVLNIGISSDANGMHIAPHHGIHPYAGLLPHDDVSNNLSRLIDIARLWNNGTDPLIGPYHDAPNKSG